MAETYPLSRAESVRKGLLWVLDSCLVIWFFPDTVRKSYDSVLIFTWETGGMV